MRNAEVIRQWKILKTWRPGATRPPATWRTSYRVTERTIRRDIEALQEAGFPALRRPGGRAARSGGSSRATSSVSPRASPCPSWRPSTSASNLLSFLGGAPFAQDLESAFGKIREALPAKSLPYLARIQDLFSARPDPVKDYSKKQDVIAGLIDAILHQRQATIAYFSFNSQKTKTYTIDPYRLVYYRGGLYLYARAHEYGEVRTFAVERIQKIEVLDQELRDPGRLQRQRVRARGVRHRRGQGRRRSSCSSTRRWRLHPRAGLAREPGRSRTVPDGVGAAHACRSPPASSSSPGSRASCLTCGVLKPASLRDEIARELDAARGAFPPARPRH